MAVKRFFVDVAAGSPIPVYGFISPDPVRLPTNLAVWE